MEGKFDVGENCQVTSLNREGKEVGLSAQEDRHFVPSKRAYRWPQVRVHRKKGLFWFSVLMRKWNGGKVEEWGQRFEERGLVGEGIKNLQYNF